MELSYKCDPDKDFRYNFEGAILTVLNRYENVSEYDIVRAVNFVRDDLNRMIKRKPTRKHRLAGVQKSVYDIVTEICQWYLDEDDKSPNDPRNYSKEYISAGGLYGRLGTLRNEVEILSFCPFFRYTKKLYAMYSNQEPVATL